MEENIININESHGKFLVWNAKDVHQLWNNHRIVGTLIGCHPYKSHQSSILSLPLQLLPVEAKFLLEKGFAKLIQTKQLNEIDSEINKKFYKDYYQKLFLEQREFYKEERQKEIHLLADKILEGKRKKLLKSKKNSMQKNLVDGEVSCNEVISQAEGTCNELNYDDITRDSVIDEEMKKIKPIPEELCMVQLFTECPWKNMEIYKNDWQFPKTDKEKLQYAVFCDLWEKGYYITSGIKFGGDFLAYAGNPMVCHALYIVLCLQYEETFTPLRLIALGRLGTYVKKTAVLATLKPSGKVSYLSLRWEGSCKLENSIKETDS